MIASFKALIQKFNSIDLDTLHTPVIVKVGDKFYTVSDVTVDTESETFVVIETGPEVVG